MADWEERLNRFIAADAGKVSAEIAKAHAESEFEKYRIVQDRLFESDFYKATKVIEKKITRKDDGVNTINKVGRAALYRGGLENCSYPDLMMRFHVHEAKVFPDFLEEYLQSNIARRHFMRCAAGTSVSMVKITKSAVEKLVINLSSFENQKSIVEIAASNNAIIKKTKVLIDSKEHQFGLLQKVCWIMISNHMVVTYLTMLQL